MLHLGELYLQLALVATRALREDIQNQPRTIKHTTLKLAFEIAFLTRGE